MKRTLLIALFGILGAAPAFAQPATGAPVDHDGERGARGERLVDKLGLDAAAAAKVRATFDKYRGELEPLRSDARKTRQALAAEVASAQPDAAKLTSLTDELGSDRQQMMSLAQERAAELKSELTPVQYAKLVLAQHRFGRRFGHHRGRGAAE